MNTSNEPFDHSLCFSTIGMDYADEYIGEGVLREVISVADFHTSSYRRRRREPS